MLDDVELADIHGQFKFNFQHAAISRDESERFLDGAFRQDFEENGPSLSYLPEHSSTDGSGTRITQRREFAHALPVRRTSFGRPITRRCGRWSEG